MKELKEYLTPNFSVINLDAEVFTGVQPSSEMDYTDDPYTPGDGNWWN